MARPSCEASTDVTQTAPAVDPASTQQDRKKAGQAGQLVAFTRHPTAVRTAVAALNAMRLSRQSDYAVMTTLILACDREGVLWPKPREIGKVTGLALNTVQASLRRLRALGLVDWVRVMPTLRGNKKALAHQRLPRRVSYKEPVGLGAGKPTRSGCRVFVVRWEKLNVSFASRDLAQDVLDRSNLDRSRDRSTWIDPSDPLPSSSKKVKSDCAPAKAGCGTPAPPPRSAPPLAANVEPLQSRGSAPAARALPPTISRPVHPPATPAPPAPPAAPSAAIARAGGDGASAEGDAPVTADRMRADLAWMFGPGAPRRP